MSTNKHAHHSKPVLRASLECEVRSMDEEKREAEFVASTERPVMLGPWEPEVLRMSGANLTRYLRNPVLLDTHDRFGLEAMIGSCTVKIEGRKLIARARYANTERGEMAWQLVRGGHCRAMSIGYLVDQKKVRKLREGETDGEGDGLVTGPASIVNAWELLEISNVPVPADADAVRGAFYRSLNPSSAQQGEEKRRMSDPANKKGIDFNKLMGALGVREEPETAGEALDAAEQMAADGSMGGEPEDKPGEKGEREEGMVTCPDCGKSFKAPERTAEEVESAPQGVPGNKTKGVAKAKLLTFPSARAAAETRERILAVTPKGLEHVAEKALLEGLDFDGCRKAVLEAHAKKHPPLGTPEPPETRAGKKDELGEISDDILLRSLENLSR